MHHRFHTSSPSNQLISHHLLTQTTTTTHVNSHPHRVMNKSHHQSNLVNNQGHQLSRRKCPVHSTHSSEGSSHYTSDSDDPETSFTDQDITEEKIYVTLKSGENLGCSVVRGPQSYPGIFVQDVKEDGVAESAGLEVGDQIVGMNGFSFYPGHYNFDDAISKIKACQQMTFTVRKAVGIHFFPQFSSSKKNKSSRQPSCPSNNQVVNKQHRIRAVVHSPPSEVTSFHLPLCQVRSVISSSEATDSDYDPEKDFDLAVNDSMNPGYSHGRIRSNNIRCKVHSRSLEVTPDDLRRMQDRLDEDRRQLQLDQIRLQEEMNKLVLERKELESLKKERLDDGTVSTTSSCEGISVSCSSILAGQDIRHHHLHSSASSCCSTSSSSSSSSKDKRFMESPTSSLSSVEESKSPPFMTSNNSNNATTASNNNTVTSQMGFLDELKQLAEKRMSHSDGLLMDTLKKTSGNDGNKEDTSNGTAVKTSALKVVKKLHPDDEKRKQHELLMEEFRSAHLRMFGSKPIPFSASSIKPSKPSINTVHETASKNEVSLLSPKTDTRLSVSSPTSVVLSPVSCRGSRPAVKILKTTKRPPPPPPLPTVNSNSNTAQASRPPLVTISTYKSHSPLTPTPSSASGDLQRKVNPPVKINLIRS